MFKKILIILKLCVLTPGSNKTSIVAVDVNFIHQRYNDTSFILNCWPKYLIGDTMYNLTIQKENTVFYSETNYTSKREYFLHLIYIFRFSNTY